MVLNSLTRSEFEDDADISEEEHLDLSTEVVALAHRAMSVTNLLVDDPRLAVDLVTAAFGEALRPQPPFAPPLPMRLFSAIVELADSPDRATSVRTTVAVAQDTPIRPGEPTGEDLRAVLEIGSRLAASRLRDVTGVPTSIATAELARSLGIPPIAPGDAPIQLAIDGADEIDPAMALTKGRGGALLREKIVASAADTFVVIADETKLVDALGQARPIPVEVARFGYGATLLSMFAFGEPRVRVNAGAPAETDNGNYIIDLSTALGEDPAGLDHALLALPGVLETGLFVDVAAIAFVVNDQGVSRMERGKAKSRRERLSGGRVRPATSRSHKADS